MKGCLGVILVITCATASLHGATATFQQGVNGYAGTSDTYGRADQATTRFPAATIVLVDNDNPVAHGLIRFDNLFGSGPGQVPLNATITSATLTLRTSNDGDPVWFHRMLVPWDETNNWNEFATSGPGLQADDIEMASIPEFTFTGSTPVPRVDTFDVTAIVQGWFDGSFPNYGWGITNQVSNGWQFDSSENGTVANRPILTIQFDAPCSPITIVTQPAGTNVNELGNVTFSVVVAGTDPMLQWFKDGSPILDATNSTYTITRVRATDAGNYTVSISNPCSGPVNSSTAALTVNADVTPPQVLFAYGTNDNVTLFVVFSEVVTNAADAANYSVFLTSDPSTVLTVASAQFADPLATEGNVVVLTLDPGSPWISGQSYSMTSSAVFDLVGNVNDPAEITPLSLYADRIFAIDDQQMWRFESSGTDIGNAWKQPGFNDSAWTNGPALLGFETAALPEPLRTPVNRTDAGGVVIRTFYFRTHFDYAGPAGEGILRFRTVLDDAAAIYLNGAEIWRIRLPQGPLNYLTEGIGGAVGDATYEGPYTVYVTNLVTGDNVIAVEVHQTGANSSDMVWGMDLASMATAITPLTIVTQPVGTNVMEPTPFTLRVVASGSSPQYQWFKDGAQIDGATGQTYTVNPSDCNAHSGQYHVVVFNDAPSSVTSSTVTVNVACDTTAPTVACLYGTNDVLVVQFSEPVTMEWDLAQFNFTIHPEGGGPALGISTVTNTSGTNFGATVLVTIDPSTPRDPGTAYSVDINGIQDIFGNFMAPVTMSIPFHAQTPLLLSTAQWRYNTSGTDLGTTWSATTFNDSTWPLGNALFDAKRPQRTNVSGIPIGTQTTLSNAANTAQIPTHYFRTHFNYSGPASATLQLNAVVDDGSIWYLNGEEIFRNRMPAAPAPITYTTLANGTVGDATNEFFHVCVDNLVNGDNVLAVEVHQSALDSSDLTFSAEVSVYTSTPPPPESRLTITRGAGNQINISWTGSGVLQESSNLSNHPNGWSNVAGVVGNSYQTTVGTGNRFFRVAPSP